MISKTLCYEIRGLLFVVVMINGILRIKKSNTGGNPPVFDKWR